MAEKLKSLVLVRLIWFIIGAIGAVVYFCSIDLHWIDRTGESRFFKKNYYKPIIE